MKYPGNIHTRYSYPEFQEYAFYEPMVVAKWEIHNSMVATKLFMIG